LFAVLGLDTGRRDKDRCVPAIQRLILLIECQRGPVTSVTDVSIHVPGRFHAPINDYQATSFETQNKARQMTSHRQKPLANRV
jgi:hypothetical protein